MQILRELLDNLTRDQTVTAGRIGPHLIAMASWRLGLAANLHSPEHVGPSFSMVELEDLVGRSARDLAGWSLQEDRLQAGIGMAALNSLLEVNLNTLVEGNAKEIVFHKAAGKNLAVVGHFPFVEQLRTRVRSLWVMEERPGPGDLSEEEGYRMLGKADVVAITGSSLINHTFERIMASCQPDSFKIMLGPSTPLSPILLDFGLDAIGGTLVEEEKIVLAMVEQGVSFRQLKGIRTFLMTKESLSRSANGTGH
ncbi:MAG: DUF364 domain-containing protein [Deltaproteobacteria bacterium]|nr:MAG: DUF364 domain-containing protein [Deltaproteobacteria bacterium]